MTTKQGDGEPNPVWIPAGHEATRHVAERIDGIPGRAWPDFVNIRLTGHFMGGCAIGDSADTGAVDPYHRLYGNPGLHVVDGSTIPANLGVNPALTITVQYVRLTPIAPKNPVVPEAAPGALRLSITPN